MITQQNNNRLYFLDNLRTFMIFLVVVLHTGLVYENGGIVGYFWIVDDQATNAFVGHMNMILDMFIMSIIFFISGYFAPISVQSKSTARFVLNKAKRLIVPWIVAVFTLIPLYKIIFLASRNLPQEPWTTYFHFNNGIVSQNWLWFLPILFIFDVIYVSAEKINLGKNRLSFINTGVLVFVVGFIFSLVMDWFNLEGWTKNWIVNFQNERLLIYFMIFLLGSVAFKRNVFAKSPTFNKALVITLFTMWIPVTIYHFFNMQKYINSGVFVFGKLVDMSILWLCFHLSLLTFLYVLVQLFRLQFNQQTRVGSFLGAHSYSVYIIHTTVLGGFAMLFLNVQWPSLAKFLTVTMATFITSNILAWMYSKSKNFLIKKREITL